MFSRFSVYLKAHNATCRQELVSGLEKAFKPRVQCEHISSVANLRDWYEKGHLNPIFYHTEPLHFKFAMSDGRSVFYTKLNASQDEWSTYPNSDPTSNCDGFQLLKPTLPLFYSEIPPYTYKIVPDAWIERLSKGLSDCKDRMKQTAIR
jgi:hypothetical protein